MLVFENIFFSVCFMICTSSLDVSYNKCSYFRDVFAHRRQKYGGSSPNSLRPISYFGSIWKPTFLQEKDQAKLSHEQGTHSNKIGGANSIVWLEIAKIPPKFQPNLSAQAQKFRIFEKKLSLDVRCPCVCIMDHIWHAVLYKFHKN